MPQPAGLRSIHLKVEHVPVHRTGRQDHEHQHVARRELDELHRANAGALGPGPTTTAAAPVRSANNALVSWSNRSS